MWERFFVHGCARATSREFAEGSQDESTLLVEFNIAESRADVLQLDALWEGYGDAAHHMELYIWDYVQGNWSNGAGLVGENNFMADGNGNADFTLTGSVTTNVSNYISAGGQVSLLVYDDSHSEDAFHDFVRLVVTVPDTLVPPVITLQPTAQNVCAGATATFTVAATGTGTLLYRWQKDAVDLVDGGDVSGATSTTLQIANVDAADVGNYRCVVTDDITSINSNNAALTLGVATEITLHPLPQVLCAGETATFTVSATGSGTLTYQWQKYDLALEVGVDLVDGGAISGATTTTLQILNVDPSNNGRYRCVVTGNCGSTPSQSDALSAGVGTVPADRECDDDVDGIDFSIFASCFNGAALLATGRGDVLSHFFQLWRALGPLRLWPQG